MIKLDNKVFIAINKNIDGFDTAPIVVNGCILVRICYIAETFNSNVLWYPSTNSVEIVR